MSEQYTTVDGARVGVLMGSASDWPTMEKTSSTLMDVGVPHECNVISAHRQPDRLAAYIKDASDRGVQVYICAAGGAAHLAGVVAAMTELPVLACPMQAWSLDGLDSLLSMAQMPKGVPVATFAIGGAGAVNAALFAASILALNEDDVKTSLSDYRARQSAKVDVLPQAK